MSHLIKNPDFKENYFYLYDKKPNFPLLFEYRLP
jgi:hypothetical protein